MNTSKSGEGDGAVLYGFVILAFVVWSIVHSAFAPKLALHARLACWTEPPLTVVGARSAAAAAASGTALGRIAANNLLVTANRLRPGAALFAVFCLLIGLYPRAATRHGHLTAWSTEALVFAGLVAGVAGVGAGLSTPLAWPGILQAVVLLIASVNIVAAAVCALLVAQRGREKRVLEHGPTFVSPESAGPSILVGRADSAILPGHARWLARAGGEIRIPFDRLSCGITILGEKGSGKSRLLFAIHDAVRARYPNVPILIHDPKGEWFRTYYEPGDLYIAPHFKDSSNWGVWKDFHEIPELRHALITAAVHAHPGSETFWMDQAVDMLESAASHKDFDQAVKYLAGIPASSPGDEFLLSVFGSARLGFLDIAKAQKMGGGDRVLSIKDYLEHRGRILLLNDPSCADQQRGVFSLFLTAFLLRALSMPDVPAGKLRAVAIIDEALTFHLPPDVDRRIYALCRSKGLCVIAGAQRLPDRHNDERGEWQNAEYTFAMKVIHQESQAALSKRAGSLLFRQKKESKSTHQSGSSKSESVQDSRHDAIPPEHFGRLDPRKFVLFHDRGIVTGETVDVRHEQRERELPIFDPLKMVTEISRQLMLGGKKK
jgi:hypothetical protein